MDCPDGITNLSNEPNDYFEAGKKVKIINNKSYVIRCQTNKGGWTESMEKYIGQIVTVTGMDFDKLIKVTTEDKQKLIVTKLILQSVTDDDSIESTNSKHQKSHDYLPAFLNKFIKKSEKIEKSMSFTQFQPGEIVEVSSDKEFVKLKQKTKGEYSEKRMGPLLGKNVKVIIQKNEIVIVEYKGQKFDMHSDVLSKIPVTSKSIPGSLNLETSKPSSSSKDTSEPDTSEPGSRRTNPILPEDESLLIEAIKSDNHTELLKHITEENKHQKDKYGNNPLNRACREGCIVKIIEELLDCGGDFKTTDNLGYSPLHHCCMSGILENVKALINFNEDTKKYFTSILSDTDNSMEIKNPIILAQDHGHEEIADFLKALVPFSNSDSIIGMSLPDPPTDIEHIIPYITQEPSLTNYTNQDKSGRGQCSDELSNSNKAPFDTITIASKYSEFSAYSSTTINFSELKRSTICKICCDREIDTLVDCGHVFCRICVERLQPCPYCKRDIFNKRPLFLS